MGLIPGLYETYHWDWSNQIWNRFVLSVWAFISVVPMIKKNDRWINPRPLWKYTVGTDPKCDIDLLWDCPYDFFLVEWMRWYWKMTNGIDPRPLQNILLGPLPSMLCKYFLCIGLKLGNIYLPGNRPRQLETRGWVRRAKGGLWSTFCMVFCVFPLPITGKFGFVTHYCILLIFPSPNAESLFLGVNNLTT